MITLVEEKRDVERLSLHYTTVPVAEEQCDNPTTVIEVLLQQQTSFIFS